MNEKPADREVYLETAATHPDHRSEGLPPQALYEIDDLHQRIWGSPLFGTYIAQDGIFQAVSPQMAAFTGYSTEELVGKDAASMIFPEDVDKVKELARKALRGERIAPYPFRIVTKQQTVGWVMEIVSPVLLRGRPAILGNSMDITEHKTVESRLLESEKLYRVILETTGAATIIVEDDMTIALVNSRFERMTGYRREEWEGRKKWPEYIAPEDLPGMIAAHRLRRLDPEAAPKHIEHGLIDSQGRIRRMHLTVDLIPGTKKSIASFVDITDWKEAEKNLRKSEKSLQIKSRNLEELNISLRVLLKQWEKERKELEGTLFSNIRKFVLPYIGKIQKSRLDDQTRAHVNMLESNLKDIIAPFASKLSLKCMNLTRREIQIAQLIKEGKTSKEIAQILNVSKSAIDIHRYRLRSKLGLNCEKVNLRSHLNDIE